MKHTMLHMKLNSAVSVFAVAAAFSVLLPPSNAFGGVCFLPDCQDSDTMHGDINMNVNNDTEWCEKKGYTYYASGQCPQYQAQVGKCKKDDYYLKCDPVKWCTDNGYNTQTCSLPSFVDGQCPNGKPYYKQCKEDRPRACTEAGYVNSCSPGRLYATSNRCQWDSSYGKCCTASPSTGCPSSYAVTCDPSRGSSGTDTCGYTCYRCCDDNCPSGTSKNYTGSYASTTECGSRCNRCKDCTSGKTYWNGSYVGSSECGSCYSCSDNCSSGSRGGASCSSGYDEVRVGSTECGSGCYGCEKHYHSYSCPSGYSTSNSSCSYGYDEASKTCYCGDTSGTCYKCKAKPAEPAHDPDDCKTGTTYIIGTSYSGWCDWGNYPGTGGGKYVYCERKKYCTTYGGSEKELNTGYYRALGPFWDDDGNGDGGEGECQAAKGNGKNCDEGEITWE